MIRGEICTAAGGTDYAGKPRPVIIVQDDRFDATSRDCREAWPANLDDRVSGTHIWIGRSPCARKRSRWA